VKLPLIWVAPAVDGGRVDRRRDHRAVEGKADEGPAHGVPSPPAEVIVLPQVAELEVVFCWLGSLMLWALVYLAHATGPTT